MATRTSVGSVIAAYRRHCEFIGMRSYRLSRQYHMDAIDATWGSRPMESLRHADIVAFLMDRRERGNGPATVRRYYASISAWLNWAVTNDFLKASPVRRGALQLAPEDNARTRRMTDDEETRIREAAGSFLNDVMTVALHTGLRIGTIRRLQFKFLQPASGRHGVLILPSRLLKNRRLHVMPLTEQARLVIDSRRRGLDQCDDISEAYVFGHERTGAPFRTEWTIRERWHAALVVARVSDLRFHDLRGEAASRLLELGVPVRVIQDFLGHTTMAMTERYLRPRVGALDESVQRLGDYLSRVDQRRPARMTSLEDGGRGISTSHASKEGVA